MTMCTLYAGHTVRGVSRHSGIALVLELFARVGTPKGRVSPRHGVRPVRQDIRLAGLVSCSSNPLRAGDHVLPLQRIGTYRGGRQ